MNNQRTFVMLEPPVRDTIKKIAHKKGISISMLCRDLIHEALEILEDSYFEKLCSEREKNFNWNNGLSHDEVWTKKNKQCK